MAEVAVVGKPYPERAEIAKVFVVLRSNITRTDALKAEQRHVRTRLALRAYPREIEFIDDLPKTPRLAVGCSVSCSGDDRASPSSTS